MPAPRNFIAILSASGFASTFSGRAVEPLIAVLAEEFAAPAERAALLSAAFALPYAFSQPFLGPTGDAFGKVRVMKVCIVILLAALFASVFAPNLPVLFALRIIAGIAAGGVTPLAIALIGDNVEMAGRQLALSRYLVAVILGQLAGSSVSGIIAAAIGWRGVFALSAGLMAAATLAIGLGLRESQPASSFKIGVALGRYRDILLNGRARTLFALVFVEAVAIFGIFPFIAPILAEQGKGGPTEAGLVLGGFAIGGLVYSLLVRWMLARLGLSRMLVSGGLVAGCALLALGSSTGWLHQALAMIGLGLGFYMLHNSFQTQVTEVAPTARASAVALHAFSFFCGQALGVVFIGYGLGTSGQAATLAVSALVIAALGAVAAWRLTGTAYPRAR